MGLGDRSLWWDESLSLYRAQRPFSDILSNTIILTDGETSYPTMDNHPPLYFLLLGWWIRQAGITEFALRWPSVAACVLLVALTFVVGRRWFGDRAGRYAALFTALSPMLLWYGQEVRMYTLAPLFGLASMYSLARLALPEEHPLEPSQRIAWMVIYVLSSVAMLLTHYLTILLLGVQGILLAGVVLRQRGMGRWIGPVVVVTTVGILVARYALEAMPPSSPAVGFAFVSLPILLRDVLNSFSLGLSVDVTKVFVLDLIFLAVACLGLVGAVQDRFNGPQRLGWIILGLYGIIPIMATYVLGYFRPIYMNSRHLIIVLPAFYLALGAGIAGLRRRPLLYGATVTIMLVGIAFSWVEYFTNETYFKDDHRAWGDYLLTHARPGDIIIVSPPHISELFQYYARPRVAWTGLPRLANPSPEETDRVLRLLASRYQRLWLAFSYTPPWGDPERLPEQWLERHAFKVEEVYFHSYASIVRVSLYLPQPPVLSALPPIPYPTEVNLDDRLIFLGHDLAQGNARGTETIGFHAYWRPGPAMDGDYKVSLRLVDDTGVVWAQQDRAPVNGRLPTSEWRAGEIIQDDMEVSLPPGLPPGAYRLQMLAYPATGGPTLIIRDANGQARGAQISLGTITVSDPSAQPDMSKLQVDTRVMAVAGPLTLLGYTLGGHHVQQGGTIDLTLAWRADRTPNDTYRLRATFVDNQGKGHGDIWLSPAAPWYPTSRWPAGYIVRGRAKVVVPATIPAGVYTLRLALVDQAERAIPLRPSVLGLRLPFGHTAIGPLQIDERPRTFTIPPIDQRWDVNLGDRVTLLGYTIVGKAGADPVPAKPGETLTVILYWQGRSLMETSYTYFTHLVDEQGIIWGQHDAVPGEGERPTTTWVPGEVVTDSVPIAIRPDTPPGLYQLIGGMYDPVTGQRLPIRMNGMTTRDYASLATVNVR